MDSGRLEPPADSRPEHALGELGAAITLVEYGSFDCPSCHTAHEVIASLRERFGERLRYVFRHRPISGSETAQPAAELAEYAAETTGEYWRAHGAPMRRRPRPRQGGPARPAAARAGAAGLAHRAGDGAAGPRRCPRKRRARLAHLLHQRPALRRPVGREHARRGDARHARAPRAERRARLRALGALDRP